MRPTQGTQSLPSRSPLGPKPYQKPRGAACSDAMLVPFCAQEVSTGPHRWFRRSPSLPTALGELSALPPCHTSSSPLNRPSVPALLLTSRHSETISTADPLLCAVDLPSSLPSNPVSSCVPCSTPDPWQRFAAINFLLPTTSPLKRGLKYHLSSKQEMFSSSCPLELKVPSVCLFPCDPWLGFPLSSLWSPPPPPSPSACLSSLLVTTQLLLAKRAVSSLVDVGHHHPKAKPHSGRVGRVAQHLKRGCRRSSWLGDPSALLGSLARKIKDLTQHYYLSSFLT